MGGVGRPDFKPMLSMFAPGNPAMTAKGGFDVFCSPETGQPEASRANLPQIRAMCATSCMTMSSARAQAAIYRTLTEGGGKLLSADAVKHAMSEEVQALDGMFSVNSTFTQGG